MYLNIKFKKLRLKFVFNKLIAAIFFGAQVVCTDICVRVLTVHIAKYVILLYTHHFFSRISAVYINFHNYQLMNSIIK